MIFDEGRERIAALGSLAECDLVSRRILCHRHGSFYLINRSESGCISKLTVT